MNRDRAVAITIAIACHGILLFGFRWKNAISTTPLAARVFQVHLVEEAPSAAPAKATPEAPPPTPPLEPPLPAPPTPPPITAFTPQLSTIPEEKPSLSKLMAHHELPKPMKAGPAMSHTPANASGSNAGKATASVPNGPSNPVRVRLSPKPAYPPEARRLGQQGRVLLEVQISADGRVRSASVKHSSGFPLLDSAAVQGVMRWTFEPARMAGLPVASRAEVPVNFSFAQ